MHPHCFCKLRVGYNGCIHHQRDILRRCATLLQAFHLLPPSSLLHSRAMRLHTEYNLELGCSLEGGETKPNALLCQHGNTVLFLFLLVVVLISFKHYPHCSFFFFFFLNTRQQCYLRQLCHAQTRSRVLKMLASMCKSTK